MNHLKAVEQIAAAHGHPALSPLALQLYWTLYLGVFAHWTTDESPKQEDTLALLDQSLKLFVAAFNADPKGEHVNERQSKGPHRRIAARSRRRDSGS
jgi:hypothetical protein